MTSEQLDVWLVDCMDVGHSQNAFVLVEIEKCHIRIKLVYM